MGDKLHPCYSSSACHAVARMHLPIAPRCNIQCNYCNRQYDCQNESRPGVTSQVLTPRQALTKYQSVKQRLPKLGVNGIAGPGDALANWQQTKQTLRLIRQEDQNVLFCLSTNGLMLPECGDELIELGVDHVTITINAIDPAIAARIYRVVRYQGKIYKGIEAAQMLVGNQLQGLQYLAERGVKVKVNTVLIPGLNDGHIEAVARTVSQLGAFIENIMPLIPVAGSAFFTYPSPDENQLAQARQTGSRFITQMTHCNQCRADAVGFLSSTPNQTAAATKEKKAGQGAYKIAVASKWGIAVDQHFGHATVFSVFQGREQNWQFIGQRQVKAYCNGAESCGEKESLEKNFIETFSDCDAVVSMRIGYHVKQWLEREGIVTVEANDTIVHGLSLAHAQLSARNLLPKAGRLSVEASDSEEISVPHCLEH